MRYTKLKTGERATLELAYKNHSKFHVRQRSHSLLLSDEGMQVYEIAKLMRVRTRTIYTWMNRWENMGIAGIMILSGRGRKPTLSIINPDVVDAVKKSNFLSS